MSDKIQKNIPLAPYTTFGIGGMADFFVSVEDAEMLHGSCEWAKEQGVPVTILGHGSNVLVADEGIRGLVVHIAIKGIEYTNSESGVRVSAGAGVLFDDLVADVVARGLWGIENLSSIPSSVGAAPVQNIGAYGVEVASCIESVEVYDRVSGTVRILDGAMCDFGYRDSIFKQEAGSNLVVTRVFFMLQKVARPNIAYKDLARHFADQSNPEVTAIREAVVSIRAEKFPEWSKTGNAGSFFKNPVITNEQYQSIQEKYPDIPGFPTSDGQVKTSTAWILDHVVHMKGVRSGNVGTYSKQPLVMVNHGGATAQEITTFAEEMKKQVQTICNITLEWEVTQLS